MDLVSRIDGYLNQEIMHDAPIPVIQTPKTFQDKKDSTLLDMALRALLKERMYGNLQNFQTENIGNKNHLKTRDNSIMKTRKLLSSLDQKSIQRNISIARKSSNNSFLQSKRQQSNEIDTKTNVKSSSKKYLAQISSSMNIHLKKTQSRKLSLMNQKKVQFLDQSCQDNKIINDRHNGTSFISSIEHLQTENLIRSSKNREIKLKLPQISDRRKMKNPRLQNVKISKALFKQNEFKITVKEEFWSFICDKKNQRVKRSKQGSIQRNESLQTSLDESINLSTGKRSINGEMTDPNKELLKYNQNLSFRKENFQNFICNEKLTIPNFVSSILSFFQVSNKFTDKATKSQFESIFISLYNQSHRAWCFAIFQFLDSNHNAKIDSSDLFNIYNIVDCSKSLIEKFLDLLRVASQQRQNLSVVNESAKKLEKMKRQKTVSSYNGSSSNRTSQNRASARLSIERSIKQMRLEVIDQKMQQIQTSIIKNNLQNVISFQKQIQTFNEKILSRNPPLKNQKFSSQNPQSASNKNKNGNEKYYLEQGLLDKKDVKISELGSILSQISHENGTKTKKVLDIDYKKLNVKLTSSYLQTFIATNHNEETRVNREFLQNLKDKVKKISESKSKLLPTQMQGLLLGIEYAQFYEQKLFLPFKNLFFAFMQILVSNK